MEPFLKGTFENCKFFSLHSFLDVCDCHSPKARSRCGHRMNASIPVRHGPSRPARDPVPWDLETPGTSNWCGTSVVSCEQLPRGLKSRRTVSWHIPVWGCMMLYDLACGRSWWVGVVVVILMLVGTCLEMIPFVTKQIFALLGALWIVLLFP